MLNHHNETQNDVTLYTHTGLRPQRKVMRYSVLSVMITETCIELLL